MVNEPSVFELLRFDCIILSHEASQCNQDSGFPSFNVLCLQGATLTDFLTVMELPKYERQRKKTYLSAFAQSNRNLHWAFLIAKKAAKCLRADTWLDYTDTQSDMMLFRCTCENITKTRLFKHTEKFTTKNIWYFLYFCSKHRLWVLVRTASARRF